MKQLLLLMVTIVLVSKMQAQKRFEGIIQYDVVSSDTAIGPSTLIKAYFKDSLVKIITIEKNKADSSHPVISESILNFSNGIGYDFDKDNKRLLTDSLDKGQPIYLSYFTLLPDSTAIVAGYSCFIYKADSIRDNKASGEDIILDARIWYAQSLYFDIPARYQRNEKGMFFTNGKNLGLGMHFKVMVGKQLLSITATATDIREQQLDPSLFTIPADYAQVDKTKFEAELMKDFKVVDQSLGEIAAPASPPPPPPPKQNKPANKKAPAKRKTTVQ